MEKSDRNQVVTQTVKQTLAKMGYDYNSLSEKDKKYLTTIEETITEIFEIEQKARAMISKNVVSIQGVSKKANIARQTLYNNELLKEYITYRASIFDNIDASKKDAAKDDEIKRLKDEITALHQRDVELMELKREVTELKKLLKEKEEIIKSINSSSRKSISIITNTTNRN